MFASIFALILSRLPVLLLDSTAAPAVAGVHAGVTVPPADGGALPTGPAARRSVVECEQSDHGPGARQAGGAGLTAVLQEQGGCAPVAGVPATTSHARGE